MQFILNPNSLPFHSHNKKSQGLQYYQWKYKQKVHQEQQKKKNLRMFLQQIEKQQNDENRNNTNKKRIHHDGTFYDYSTQWKKKVEEKIQEQKILKQMEVEKQEDKSMKKQSKEDRREVDCDHKGPIEGWQQHFENYLKKKSYYQTAVPEELTFEPKINQRSRKMTEGMVGKVEDRLIKFGQFLKQRNQEEINKQNTDLVNYSFSNNNYSSNQSDIFYRLYKQSEETNRKKRQLLENDDVHTFHPKINKLPQQLESRIIKRRKPLYYIKNELKDEQNDKEHKENAEDKKTKRNKGDFQAFIKRNQALLDAKRKMMMALRQQIDEKQNIQKSHCTFSPVLNKNSKKIRQKSAIKNKKFEQQILSQIKQSQSSPQKLQQTINNQGLDNIDISKLTIPQNKQIDQSDSLSIYRTSRLEQQQQQLDSKSTNRSMKKQSQYDTYVGSLGNGESIKIKSERMSIQYKVMQKEESGRIRQENVGEEDEGKGGHDNAVEDSIQKMKTTQWQSQFEQIESHLQNMIKRAQR